MIKINNNKINLIELIKSFLLWLKRKIVQFGKFLWHLAFPICFENWVSGSEAIISFGSYYFNLTYLGIKINSQDHKFYSTIDSSKLSETDFCIFKRKPLQGRIGLLLTDDSLKKCSKVHIEIKYKIFIVTRTFKKDVLFEDLFCK